MTVPVALSIVIGAYLLGSVSFAALLTRKLAGVDLRTVGSGNLGATNASRVLGRKWGIFIYVLDFLKGFAPVFFVARCAGDPRPFGDQGVPLSILAGVGAFAGHCYPVWHAFRGGKGVATASGVLFGLDWRCGLIVVLVFGTLVAIFRIISLGSIAAAIALPLAWVLLRGSSAFETPALWTTILFAFFCIWVVLRHRANVRRLISGDEPRIGRRQ